MQKTKKQLWVIANNDYAKLESAIPLEPIYGPTSRAEDLIVVGYEGEQQEIGELFTKLKTEPFKSQILRITDDKQVLYDATKSTLAGQTIYSVKRQCVRILREQSRTNPNAELGEEVYHWSSLLTAESRYTENEEE